ncbi:MAG: hypothetical protein ACKODB_15725 [Betaproteobacteria bacterium]|jgi:hypothetical protein
MQLSQAELDDLLEDLIAYTKTPDADERARRLARLCLLLMDACADPERVREALDTALRSIEPRVSREID